MIYQEFQKRNNEAIVMELNYAHEMLSAGLPTQKTHFASLFIFYFFINIIIIRSFVL